MVINRIFPFFIQNPGLALNRGRESGDVSDHLRLHQPPRGRQVLHLLVRLVRLRRLAAAELGAGTSLRFVGRRDLQPSTTFSLNA